MFYTQNTTICL